MNDSIGNTGWPLESQFGQEGQGAGDGALTAWLGDRLAAFVTDLPIPVWIKDLGGHYLYANDSYSKCIQMHLEEILGKSDFDLYPQDIAWQLQQNDARAIHEGKAVEVNEEVPFPDGSIRDYISTKFPLRGPDGKPDGVGGIAVEIGALKATERALRQSEQRYRLLFDRNPDGVFSVDSSGRFTEVNAACEKITGYSRAELLQKTFLDLSAPDERTATLDHFMERLRDPAYAEFETALLHKNGSRVEVWVAAKPLVSEGKVVAVHCTAKDITARKRAEQDLRYTWIQNPALGYSADQVAGTTDYDLFERPEDAQRLEIIKRRVLTAGMGERHEIEIFDEGAFLWYDLTVQPQREDDKVVGVLCAAVDITERKQTEAALRRSRDRFEVLSLTASRLLAAPDPQVIIHQLCEHVRTFLGCAVFFSFLLDAGRRRLRLNACGGVEPGIARKVEDLELGASLCGTAALGACRVLEQNLGQSADPRSELIRSLGVRAYACHPLLGPQNEVLGTLSFGASNRDVFTPEDLELMKTVADHVAVALLRRRAAEALRESEHRLAFALEGGQMGMWEWDVRTGQSVWNAQEYELLGLPPGDGQPATDLFLRHLHPEDKEGFHSSLENAFGNREDWRHEFRIIRADGCVRWLEGAGRATFGKNGQPEKMVGVNYDITERKQFQGELERLVTERTARLQELVTAPVHDRFCRIGR